MEKINGNKIINLFAAALSSVLFVIALICTVGRINDLNGGLSIKILASSFSMPQGRNSKDTEGEKRTAQAPASKSEVQDNSSDKNSVSGEVSYTASNEPYDDEAKYSGDKLPVIEQHIGSSGYGYDNFSVKNTTDYTIDYEELLSSDLGFEVSSDKKSPQVLIYHTHTTEAYLINDNGYYFTDYSFRSEDPERSVVAVGDEIVKVLEKKGIPAIHATEIHDRTYTGSYDRSEQTVYKYMEKYPDIKVTLDIHRDAIGYDDERGKYKPVFTYNGKKAAQIMIMSGYDPENEYGLGHWKENLKFALKLQQKAETLYPGMTRPLYFGDFTYNMFINNGSLLIEVGTESNTLSEAKYTGNMLGNVIAQVLNENKK